MDTSRDDVGISIRSAFLRKGTQQRFSLFVLTVLSVLLIFLESLETKPLNIIRAFIKDTIFRGSLVASFPSKSFSNMYGKNGIKSCMFQKLTDLGGKRKKRKYTYRPATLSNFGRIFSPEEKS